MKFLFCLVLPVLITCSFYSSAQNVGIGTATPPPLVEWAYETII